VAPEELSLLRVYRAVAGTERVHVFDLHQNPNDECIVGRHIRPVLTDVFRGIEERAELELRSTTLADCMQKMRAEIDKERLT
jgi:DNA-binding IscR family transcriptional regulator